MLLRAALLLGLFLHLSCGVGPVNSNHQPASSDSPAADVPPTPPEEIPNKNVSGYEPERFYPYDECKPKRGEDRRLCIRIIKDLEMEDHFLYHKFEYISRPVDLNGDGKFELVIRVPASTGIGGTSGYPVFIYSKTGKRLKKVWDLDQGWTPILVMESKSHGWRDIALQFGGGGVDWGFEILKFNGKTYKTYRTQNERPKGEVLIEKDWSGSFYGPLPKN